MEYKYEITGPLTLTEVDDSDSTYLKLSFDDGHTRKMAKGGKWPPHLAKEVKEKADKYEGQQVYFVTSWTTKQWSTTDWLCRILSQSEGERQSQIESKRPQDDDIEISYSGTSPNFFVVAYPFKKVPFSHEADFEEFRSSVKKELISSWRSTKHARSIRGDDIKRIRISKLSSSKSDGYRVVVWEAPHKSSDSLPFFVILRVDDKLKNEKPLRDKEIKEIKDRVKNLSENELTPEKVDARLQQ